MKEIRAIIAIFILLQAVNVGCLSAQTPSPPASVASLEQQYEHYISGALRFQVRSDSLLRTANLNRRELAFSGDATSRKEKERLILYLENESVRLQRQADSLYSQARATELRILAARKESGTGNIQSQPPPAFLVLGGNDLSMALTRSELYGAREIEADYERAAVIIDKVSDLSGELEQLGHLLDSNPPRRERRRINRRIDELNREVFRLRMEALQVYQKTNAIRYVAATRFLAEKRLSISDSLIIKSGLAHEENAAESFRNAGGLRKSASDMRSDRYLEDFMLRANNEEIKAFSELETALEIYNTPAVPAGPAGRGTPLGADGRLDPGLALSRARSRGPEATTPTGPKMDFGFEVLPRTPYSVQNPIPANVVLPMGMVYSVQLGIFSTIMTPGSFGGLYPVMAERESDNESVRYMTGLFRNIAEAERALVDVNRQGFSDAFIIAYNDGIRMPLTRARQMERNALQNASVLQQTEGISEFPSELPAPSGQATSHTAAGPEVQMSNRNVVPGTVSGTASVTSGTPGVERATVVTFRIQIGALSRPVDQDVLRRWNGLAGGRNIEYEINNRGLYVYSAGNFNTFEEVVKVRELFRENGVPDAFIIPFRGDLRISLEEANKLIQGQ